MIKKSVQAIKEIFKDIIILYTKMTIDQFLDDIFQPVTWMKEDFKLYMGVMGRSKYTVLQWYNFFDEYTDYTIEKLNEHNEKHFGIDADKRVAIYPDYYYENY